MNDILKGIEMVVFDLMGVIITDTSLVAKEVPSHSRVKFLDKYVIGSNFEDFKTLLKEKNIKMSILSNMPESWGRYLCSKFNLDKDFNPILFSSVVGISKPNRGIFIELFKETGINPEKMLFIDDQLKNLKTASELGMKTMLFSQKSIKEESFSPDYIISSFKTVSG